MFDAVAPTVEVASATGVATGFADFLHDFGEIDTFDYFSGSGRKLCVLRHDVAGKARRLFVVGRGVVAFSYPELAAYPGSRTPSSNVWCGKSGRLPRHDRPGRPLSTPGPT